MKSSAKIRLAVAIESDRKKFIFDVYSRHISHSAFVIASIFLFKGNFFIDKYHSKKLCHSLYIRVYMNLLAFWFAFSNTAERESNTYTRARPISKIHRALYILLLSNFKTINPNRPLT